MVNFWQDKKVIVTGAHGFLGKHLVGLLNEAGCNPFVPDKEYYNLLSSEAMLAILSAYDEIDILFHLAANVGGIGYNQKYPYDLFFQNITMGLNLIHLSIGRVKKFIQIGTTCSYPKYCPKPFREDDFWDGYPEETNAAYGIAKKMLLTQLQAARQQFNFNGIYIILANLYGPGDNFDEEKSHVIPALIRKIDKAEHQVMAWGSGTPSRDFLYVEDAARGILQVAEKHNGPEPINLGSGVEVNIAAVVNILKELMLKEHLYTVWSMDKNGQPDRLLDISRAQSLGWKPEIKLREGLARTIEWYREHYAKD